jgi:hypothetical protein
MAPGSHPAAGHHPSTKKEGTTVFPTPFVRRRAATLALSGLLCTGLLSAVPATAAIPTRHTASAAVLAVDPARKVSDSEIARITQRLRSLPPAETALRAKVIRIANGEIGTREHGLNCQKYGGCMPWCGVFTRWVWQRAGVSKMPRPTPVPGKPEWRTARYATYWGDWAANHHRFKPNRPGQPTPGDAIVYGAPGTDGHIGIVLRVHADGTLTTAEGNYGDMVSRRHIDPRTAIGGGSNQHVYGYVTPTPSGG